MSKHKKSKKTNPRRKPVSEAELKTWEHRAISYALIQAKCMCFHALIDKGFLQPEQVKPAWDAVKYLADSKNKGYVKLQDLYDSLRDEYGVDLGVGNGK